MQVIPKNSSNFCLLLILGQFSEFCVTVNGLFFWLLLVVCRLILTLISKCLCLFSVLLILDVTMI